MRVDVEGLVIDERCQARAVMDEAALEDYAARYDAMAPMPAISVVDVGGELYVVDGFHRAAAMRKAGCAFTDVDVVGKGDVDYAIWVAAGQNRAHGVRRTRADKRRAVLLAVSCGIGPDTSSRAIAEHVGVSATLVSEVRAQWEASIGAAPPETRVGRDGRRRRVSRPDPDDAPTQPVPVPEPVSTTDIAEDPMQTAIDYVRHLMGSDDGEFLASFYGGETVTIRIDGRVFEASRGIDIVEVSGE